MKISIIRNICCGENSYIFNDAENVGIIDPGDQPLQIIAQLQKLNIKDLKIKILLTHGHYDHSGGILSFVKINPNATIYIQKNAVNDYYSIRENGPAYIGIDKKILLLSNIVYIDDLLNIDDELTIFSNITDRKFWPQTNQRLKKRENGVLIQDDFDHEQCLVVNENNCSYLFSGCAHNGIVNILKRYDQIFKKYPDKIISGFHMIKKIPYDRKISNI